MNTPNEGLNEIDKDMEALRAEAAATDAGQSISSAEDDTDNGTSENDESKLKDENATDSQRSDTGADDQAPQDEVTDKDKPKTDDKTKEGEKPEGQETPYAGKKRGAQARIEELAREKNEQKERAEALQKRIEELEKTSTKPASAEEPADKKPAVKGDPYPQHTIEELEQAADDYDADGDTEMAAKCRKAIVAKAKAIAAHRQEDTQAVQQRAHEEFSAGWKGTLGEMVKEDPKLATNDYPLAKEIQSLVSSDKWGRFFLSHPDGARAALEVGKLRLSAARVPDLEKKVAELTKENKRLEGLTAINPAPPTTQQSDRKFEELSADEQREELRKEAERMDG